VRRVDQEGPPTAQRQPRLAPPRRQHSDAGGRGRMALMGHSAARSRPSARHRSRPTTCSSGRPDASRLHLRISGRSRRRTRWKQHPLEGVGGTPLTAEETCTRCPPAGFRRPHRRCAGASTRRIQSRERRREKPPATIITPRAVGPPPQRAARRDYGHYPLEQREAVCRSRPSLANRRELDAGRRSPSTRSPRRAGGLAVRVRQATTIGATSVAMSGSIPVVGRRNTPLRAPS